MTTNAGKPVVRTPRALGNFRLPDPPPREPDEMTSYDSIHQPGNSHHLIQHLGNSATTLVAADRWIIAEPGSFRELARYPDLLIAFDVDPVAYQASNGYIISEQGKPPDFVLEVASESTADTDTSEKRDDYAQLLIPEYWRFDQTGEYHGTRLAGDRLVNGAYQAIDIHELSEDVLQGYSRVLNLYLRWERGELGWYDPATDRHIVTFGDLQERLDQERASRMEAEARVRELEAELGRLRNQSE